MLTSRLSYGEALWLLITFIGAVASLVNLLEAMNDLGAIKRAHVDGPRILVASGTVGREALRCVTMFTLGVIGVVASYRPGDSTAFHTTTSAVMVIGFFVVILALTINSFWDKVDRIRLLGMLDDLAEKRAKIEVMPPKEEEGEPAAAT